MNTKLKIFGGILLAGTFLLVSLFFFTGFLDSKKRADTSDAKDMKGTITLAYDSWVGYFPLCSKNMKSRLRSEKWLLKCIDDKADIDSRVQKLKSGELNFAVATVDSYLASGLKEDYPATIVTVIDESKGGDAIVARKSVIKSLNDLKTKTGYKVAYTPASPSEHLLRSISHHFDIDSLKDKNGAWRVTADGSSDALKMLTKGKVDVAVLWEPDVTKATSQGDFIKIIGTEDMSKVIVDILLVNRDFGVQSSEVVEMFMSTYYRTLKYYKNNPDVLKKDIKEETKLSDKQVDSMLKGVSWVNLYDNAVSWFGLAKKNGVRTEDLYESLESTLEILISSGDLESNPLPNGDPYVILNRMFVENLYNKGLTSQTMSQASVGDEDEFEFGPLAADRWEQLREVGTLKVRPITFKSGTSVFDTSGELELENAVKSLQHYPKFRVYIKGHTGKGGDSDANLALSQMRADAVKDYLIETLKVNPYRVMAKGMGSTKPLPRKGGESYRAYKYRLPRVELFLMDEVF